MLYLVYRHSSPTVQAHLTCGKQLHTLNSSLWTFASLQIRPTPLPYPSYVRDFLAYSGAHLLRLSQLVGAAGPGGGLSPCNRRLPGFGLGASTSAMCRMRLRSGGTLP